MVCTIIFIGDYQTSIYGVGFVGKLDSCANRVVVKAVGEGSNTYLG